MKNKKELYFFLVVGFFILFFLFAREFLPSTQIRSGEQRTSPEEEYTEDYKYYRAIIIEVNEENIDIKENFIEQLLTVEVVDQEKRGEFFVVENSAVLDGEEIQRFKKGDRVVLMSHENELGEEVFLIGDHDRMMGIIIISLIFLLVIFYFGRGKGLGAVLGFIFSMIVLLYYIVPNIISGSGPVQTTLVGSIIIASVSLFLAHGINKRTPIIWGSTVITLVFAILISYFFVDLTSLFGRGSELSITFQFGEFSYINLKGLLLAGMVVGVLGVLSDVTSTQTTVIWQLKKANPEFKFKELYESSLVVGREHIAALVNTLALVYVGASLPLIILLKVIDYMPFWVTINSEPMAEEIVRAIIGSTSLILAVPISSFLAAYFIGKMKKENFIQK